MTIKYSDLKQYDRLGWSVIAVRKILMEKGHKKPLFYPWAQYQKRQPTDAKLREWAEDKPEALAVVTGKVSGVVVIDVDEADQSDYTFLDSPMKVKTALSGGVHYYFKWTPKLSMFSNRVKIMDLPMDYRGEGGLAFLPPTEVNGGKYEFIGEMTPSNFDLEALPELPDEILVQMQEEETRPDEAYLEIKSGSVVLPELFEGERNTQSTRVIGSLLAKSNPEIWEAVIWPQIKEWNKQMVSPPQSERALRSTFDQITRRELRKRDEDVIFKSIKEENFTDLLKEQIGQQADEVFLTGYRSVDEAIGGFHYYNAYLVSGLEKSGKSSWLMGMLQDRMKKGVRIGFVNTELSIYEFSKRMASYWKNKPMDMIEDEEIVAWADKYSSHFEYLGVEQLTTQEQMFEDVASFLDRIDCLVFDNITSWVNKIKPGFETYQVTGDLLNSLIKITKKNKIVTFFVLHTKHDVVISSRKTPSFKQIESDPRFAAMEKSMSYVRQPTVSDVYGGGQALSQISGAVIIWRPYQKLSQTSKDHQYDEIAKIVLESMRHSPRRVVEAVFRGDRGRFLEYEQQQITEKINEQD